MVIDAVRSYASGFIFTTALPPAICAAATAAIRHLKTSNWERERHQDRVAQTKSALGAAGLPVMPTETHIIPLLVGCADKCKAASDRLLAKHGIYIQPINFPTVPRGTERLRITPTPYHEDMHIDDLVRALIDVWEELGLERGTSDRSRTKAPRARSLRLLHARETLEPRRNRTSSATPTKAVVAEKRASGSG
jgi:5-aminolevulinate synthase